MDHTKITAKGGLSPETGVGTWVLFGAGQLPGVWGREQGANRENICILFGTFKLFKESTQKPSKTGAENKRKCRWRGSKADGSERAVQPLVVTIKLHSNCFRPYPLHSSSAVRP